MSDNISKKDGKPIGERLQEAVHLLKQLQGIGINENTVGYSDLKAYIDVWVRENIGWSGTILFPRFLRKANVILPTLAGRVATIHLSTIT